jgi:hypothetical protein
VADSNKCFSLWLNSARKQVYDKIKIYCATQRPLSSITPAGFRAGSGRLLSNRPPSAQASSVPKLPQMGKY